MPVGLAKALDPPYGFGNRLAENIGSMKNNEVV